MKLIHNRWYYKFAIALVNSDLVTAVKHGGHIKCEITGIKKYSKYLEQSGLEIPDRLTISNANKTMTDVIKKTAPSCWGVQKN